MSRTNLAHLEPSARTVLSVADSADLPMKVEPASGEIDGDLDHLCRLLVRTERSLSLVNRRSFAAALADVPPVPNQALRPAPPFPEAVSVAREDGKLLERTRLFLAQNPRALDELTPELTFALLRHFDPSVRLRPAPFLRHLVAVGGVSIIALTAVALGIIHTQQNEAVTAFLNPPVQPMPAKVRVEELPRQPAPLRADHAAHPRYENEIAVIPRTAPPPLVPLATPLAPSPASNAPAHAPGTGAAASVVAPVQPAPVQPQLSANRAAVPPRPAEVRTASARPPLSAPASVGTAPLPPLKDATALVLRTIVAENPEASIDWIRAGKASDQVVTVTSQVRLGATVTKESYRLWSGHGTFTVIRHDTSVER